MKSHVQLTKIAISDDENNNNNNIFIKKKIIIKNNRVEYIKDDLLF